MLGLVLIAGATGMGARAGFGRFTVGVLFAPVAMLEVLDGIKEL